MRVKDVMTKRLITIDVDRSVYDAIKLMRKKKVSRLLVKDKGKIIGIITERDVVKRLGYWKERKLLTTHIYVSSAYTKDLKTIEEDEDVGEASRRMLTFGISSLVVTKGGKVVGIVTKTDLLKLLKEKDIPVKVVMKKPITIPLGSTLLQARKIMMERGIKRLPVMHGNKLVGIVTESDIARALTSFRKLTEGKHLDKKMKRIKVDDVMSRDLITVNEDATVSYTSSLMVKNNISCLPVMRNSELVGIVTKTDLIKVLVE